jgi:hypothetical protein
MSDEGQLSDSASSLRAGFAMSGMRLSELWTAYVGLGGSLTVEDLDTALCGARSLSAHEHDLVAQAMNDHFTERGQNHPVAYSNELAQYERRSPRPSS